MKSIYFTRHSFAENTYSKPDFERQITQEGFKRIESQSLLINKLDFKIDLILCSSAKRTVQTAQYLKEKLKIEKNIIQLDWLYEDYPTHKFLELIQKQDNTIQSLMIVAHNPTISIMATNFNNYENYDLMPAGVIKMDFDVQDWCDIDIRQSKNGLYLK